MLALSARSIAFTILHAILAFAIAIAAVQVVKIMKVLQVTKKNQGALTLSGSRPRNASHSYGSASELSRSKWVATVSFKTYV
jgi:hypothetical protein